MEIYNEIILMIMIVNTLCFTEVMSTEASVDSAWFFVFTLGLYMTVHVISLMSDTVKKLFKWIWKMLNKCACGKYIRARIKRRLVLLKKKKMPPKKIKVKRPVVVIEPDSESSAMPTPNSSMNISEYEELVNEYTQRMDV